MAEPTGGGIWGVRDTLVSEANVPSAAMRVWLPLGRCGCGAPGRGDSPTDTDWAGSGRMGLLSRMADTGSILWLLKMAVTETAGLTWDSRGGVGVM